jgi:hypothetical protein
MQALTDTEESKAFASFASRIKMRGVKSVTIILNDD